MYHMTQFEVDEDEEIRNRKIDAAYKLISVKPKSFSVEDYAKFYKVEQGTVRQWIRRGKLRTAYKVGTE